MPRRSSLPCLALALVIAFLAVHAEGRAFFGTESFFQDAQLNNGTTTTGLGLFGSFLEALAALHQTHDLSSLFLGGK